MGTPLTLLVTQVNPEFESTGSTGTRDAYHGNKIQFSRTEGRVCPAVGCSAAPRCFAFRPEGEAETIPAPPGCQSLFFGLFAFYGCPQVVPDKYPVMAQKTKRMIRF